MFGSIVAQMPRKDAVQAHKGPDAKRRAPCACCSDRCPYVQCPQFRERRNILCPNPNERGQGIHFPSMIKALIRLSQPGVRMRVWPKTSNQFKRLEARSKHRRRHTDGTTMNLASRCHLSATPWSRLSIADRLNDELATRMRAIRTDCIQQGSFPQDIRRLWVPAKKEHCISGA